MGSGLLISMLRPAAPESAQTCPQRTETQLAEKTLAPVRVLPVITFHTCGIIAYANIRLLSFIL